MLNPRQVADSSTRQGDGVTFLRPAVSSMKCDRALHSEPPTAIGGDRSTPLGWASGPRVTADRGEPARSPSPAYEIRFERAAERNAAEDPVALRENRSR